MSPPPASSRKNDPGLPSPRVRRGARRRRRGARLALLASPGRAGIAVQRFGAGVTPDPGWSRPISPYSPLLPVPAATPLPHRHRRGDSGAVIAWREASQGQTAALLPAAGCHAQLAPQRSRCPATSGSRAIPTAAPISSDPPAAGIAARHILVARPRRQRVRDRLAAGPCEPRVGALTINRAGDLFAGYIGGAAAGSSGVGLLKAAAAPGASSGRRAAPRCVHERRPGRRRRRVHAG